MKKWTRKLAWLLAIVLLLSTCLFTFTACDEDDEDEDDVKTVDTLNGKTPLEAFIAAEEKMDLAENAELSGEFVVTMNMNGQGFSATQTMTMSMLEQKNGETLYSKMQTQSSGVMVDAPDSLEESWLVGGTLYEHTKSDGEESRIKTSMTYDEYFAEHGDEDNDEFFIDLDSGLLDGAKFKKDGSTYHVDVKLTGDQIQQYAADLIASFDDMVAFDTLNYRMSFDKDGNLKGFDISFSGEETQDGMTLEMEITVVVEIKYGTVGTINPPEDAYRYTNQT